MPPSWPSAPPPVCSPVSSSDCFVGVPPLATFRGRRLRSLWRNCGRIPRPLCFVALLLRHFSLPLFQIPLLTIIRHQCQRLFVFLGRLDKSFQSPVHIRTR